MEEFVVNEEIERELEKKVRKKFKRWKTGRWIVLLLFVIIAGIAVILGIRASKLDAMAVIMVSIIFVPLIIIFPTAAYSFAISGGRDILLARAGEKVYLDATQLRNVFAPKAQQTTDAVSLEIHVPYDKIIEMQWNADMCRLEITAEYKHIQTKYGFRKEQLISDKPVILYGYFESMEKMMDLLETYANKKIAGRDRV